MNTLKLTLLELNLVVNNDYLDKYVQLIMENESRTKEKFRTQIHHIIPRCYYVHHNKKVDSSKLNTVVLLHKDHVLAHYYLYRCAKEEWFQIANIDAFKHVLNNVAYKEQSFYDYERKMFVMLDDYQLMMEKTNQAKSKRMTGIPRGPMSEEHKEKLRQANLGKTQSLETRQKRSEANRGQKRTQEFCQRMSQLATGRKMSEEAIKKAIETRAKNGNNRASDETREKMRLSAMGKHKGKIYVNNGIVSRMIHPDEFDNLSADWVIGNIKGRKWMTNGSSNTMVFPSEIDMYVSKGYWLGTTRKTKN